MNPDDITFLEEKAIQAAVKKDWPEAISLNKKILRKKSKHAPTLNRLGLAYTKTQQFDKAREAFRKVLKINPNHQIALKNLNQLKQQKKTSPSPTPPTDQKDFLRSFIEIPGISRNIPLTKVGEPKTLSSLEIGQPLQLKSSARKIKILTRENQYVGHLPDNLSLRFIKLINSGYKYSVHLKSNQPKNIQVFIEETKRSKKLRGIPTFPVNKNGAISLEKLKQPQTTPLEIYDPLAESEED